MREQSTTARPPAERSPAQEGICQEADGRGDRETPGAGGAALPPSRGVREALPIVLGYLPIGFAYGVLGAAVGVPLWAIVGMSVVVYAGSAQFLAVGLLDQGASALTLVTTTFLVNLRHTLYATAIAPYLESMGRGRLAWVAAEVTDESFVMNMRAARGTRSLPFGFTASLNATAQLSWITASLLGGLVGGFVGDPLRFGLDYALIAMFVALLALQTDHLREVVIGLVAGLVSLAFWTQGHSTVGVIVATLAASGVGLFFPAAEEDSDAGTGPKEAKGPPVEGLPRVGEPEATWGTTGATGQDGP